MAHKHFSIEEREEIQQGIWNKESVRGIAERLERSPSSVSREINKNIPAHQRRYTSRLAETRAQSKRHEKQGRIQDPDLRTEVIAGLKEGWSPEQVAGRIKEKKLGSISYETIYQFVYEDWKQGEDLRPLLKRRHKARQQKGVRKWQRLPNPNKPSIEDRPAVVGTRSRVGDWEGDLVVSRESKEALVTMVERKSGYLCVEKISSKTIQHTAGVMSRRLKGAKTLTLDNGSENNGWKGIEEKTGAKVYFAHPYSSWERGTNENTNGLIRWYLPKKTDFAKVSAERVRAIEYALNNRPRKRLGYRTPEEVFNS